MFRIRIFVLFLFCHYFANAVTLEDIIDIAKQNNQDIKISKNNEKVWDKKTSISESKRLGKLSAIGSYTNYNDKRTLAPLAPPISPNVTTSRDIFSVGVRYEVKLFDGYGDIADIKISDLEKKRSIYLSRITKKQIVYNVKSLYVKVLSLSSLKTAQQSYLESLKELQKDVKLAVKEGIRADLDILKISSDIQKVEATLDDIKSNIKILQNSLNILAGKQIEYDSFEPLEEDILTKLENKDTSKEVESLPSLKVSKLKVEKSKKEYVKAVSSYYPKVTAYTHINNSFGEGDSEQIWQSGLDLNWVVYDWGGRDRAAEIAQISKINASLEHQKQKNKLTQDIQNAKQNIQTYKSRYQSAKKEHELTSRVLKVEKLRYEESVIDTNDYLYAKAQERMAYAKRVSSRYELVDGYFYLHYLLDM